MHLHEELSIPHAEALTLLDQLLATSDAAALQDLITTLQATVEEHHDLAMTTEASLP